MKGCRRLSRHLKAANTRLSPGDTEKARGQGPQSSPDRCEGSEAGEVQCTTHSRVPSGPRGALLEEAITKGLPGAEVTLGPTFLGRRSAPKSSQAEVRARLSSLDC